MVFMWSGSINLFRSVQHLAVKLIVEVGYLQRKVEVVSHTDRISLMCTYPIVTAYHCFPRLHRNRFEFALLEMPGEMAYRSRIYYIQYCFLFKNKTGLFRHCSIAPFNIWCISVDFPPKRAYYYTMKTYFTSCHLLTCL